MANKKAEEPEHVASSSSESGSDDEQNDNTQQEQQDGDGSPGRLRQSRNEKKARKAVLRQGMKQMPEIVKVLIHKSKQAWFVLRKPDVYKSMASDTYVIFGRAEPMMGQATNALEAAQRFTQGMQLPSDNPDYSASAAVAAAASAAKDAPEMSEVPADIDPEDVKVLEEQFNISRAAAVKALRETGNDLVEAVLKLHQ